MILEVPCLVQEEPRLAKFRLNSIEKIKPHESGVNVFIRGMSTPLFVTIPYEKFKNLMASYGKVFDERK